MDLFRQIKEALGGNKLLEPVNRINRIARTIDSLNGLLKDAGVPPAVKERINGLMSLVTTRPTIAGINHYFNHFLLGLEPENQPPVIRELLEVYHDRWKNVERRTAELAFGRIDLDDEPSLLLHGSDKAVAALFDILMVKQTRVQIYQTLGRPGEQGRAQAEKLAAAGFDVQLLDDSCIGRVLPEVDYVLLGCDVILPNDFISIPGTHTLVAAARYYKRPVYLLGDTRRIMNTRFFPKNVTSTLLGEGKSRADKIWKNPPDRIRVMAFDREPVPNYLVTRFFLENGSYTPDELKDQIDKVMVTKFF